MSEIKVDPSEVRMLLRFLQEGKELDLVRYHETPAGGFCDGAVYKYSTENHGLMYRRSRHQDWQVVRQGFVPNAAVWLLKGAGWAFPHACISRIREELAEQKK